MIKTINEFRLYEHKDITPGEKNKIKNFVSEISGEYNTLYDKIEQFIKTDLNEFYEGKIEISNYPVVHKVNGEIILGFTNDGKIITENDNVYSLENVAIYEIIHMLTELN